MDKSASSEITGAMRAILAEAITTEDILKGALEKLRRDASIEMANKTSNSIYAFEVYCIATDALAGV